MKKRLLITLIIVLGLAVLTAAGAAAAQPGGFMNMPWQDHPHGQMMENDDLPMGPFDGGMHGDRTFHDDMHAQMDTIMQENGGCHGYQQENTETAE
ncbi:hypothetical protein [Alkalicoccus urumqiensis]|uniref:Uncharacterized protein n=1 Tax=Alkalicoccus urumqiensis TaxID=1548213 RepID=A0A2P6MJP4_ALKUR|nr:hypothetical protein [Alkalicoccus urumqiensis]PRO66483.1 hypothetical protein C6I21_03845 [Alkalicoccus urumqiensis]